MLDEHKRIVAPRRLEGVDLRDSEQDRLFESLSLHMTTMPFPDTKSEMFRYFFNNDSYGFGDASIYWSVIQTFSPRRIVEVGCGYSSALVLDSLQHLGMPTICTFVEPYPERARSIIEPIDDRHVVVPTMVQNLDLEVIESLEPNDILFIDSTHVVKTGSDVHHEITEILPRVPRGVIVHFHDMFYPFEYPTAWTLDNNHGWNELYFIHSFLMYNSAFEILFFNSYFARVHSDVVREKVPSVAERFLLNPGGGLWLRRT